LVVLTRPETGTVQCQPADEYGKENLVYEQAVVCQDGSGSIEVNEVGKAHWQGWTFFSSKTGVQRRVVGVAAVVMGSGEKAPAVRVLVCMKERLKYAHRSQEPTRLSKRRSPRDVKPSKGD
jgi:hypothetical protein